MCVDSNRFLGAHTTNKLILRQESLIVESVFDNYGIFLKGELKGGASNYIHREEFECFRIKLQSPTFIDLMRVVSKAKDDGIIKDFSESVRIYWNGSDLSSPYSDSYLSINNAINKINSLYTETFVIGKFDDLKKINLKNSVVKFLNGFESQIKSVDWQSDGGNISLYDGEFYVDFDIMKGATVTQKR